MKIKKFTDKKKETIALILVSAIVLVVSLYVVYLVKGLTNRVYDVFRRPVSGDSFIHFDFVGYEELVPPPPVPATSTASTTATSAASTTTSTLP